MWLRSEHQPGAVATVETDDRIATVDLHHPFERDQKSGQQSGKQSRQRPAEGPHLLFSSTGASAWCAALSQAEALPHQPTPLAAGAASLDQLQNSCADLLERGTCDNSPFSCNGAPMTRHASRLGHPQYEAEFIG
jgi:hypothetical protein